MTPGAAPIIDHDDADDVYGRDHDELRIQIDLTGRDDSDCDHAYVAQCGCVSCIFCGRRAA